MSAFNTLDNGRGEWGECEYMGLVGHYLRDDVVLHKDGSLQATVHIPGAPFELEAIAERNARPRQLNALISAISDDNVTIFSHLVRHRGVTPYRPGEFTSRFARELLHTYTASRIDGRLFQNDWFLTIVVAPRAIPVQAYKRLMSRLRPNAAPSAATNTLTQLEDIMFLVMAHLGPSGAQRLGIRPGDEHGNFSEIAEAMHLVHYGRPKPIRHIAAPLGACIYTERAICGWRGIEILGVGGSYFGRIYGLCVYMDETDAGHLNGLLSLPGCMVLTQTFKPKTRAQAKLALYLQEVQMANANDDAVDQLEELADAKKEVAGGVTVYGTHHFSLAVYSPTLDGLDKLGADACSRVPGAIMIAEQRGCFAAYWAQIPGSPEYLRTRPGDISAENFAFLSSFDGFPAGAADGYWGAPLIRFATNGGTAFDMHPHVDGVGHTLCIGRTGSGKTAYLTFLACAMEQAGATVVFLDKDRGAEPMIRMTGGRYVALRAGQPSGLAPLRALDDTPANRAFLQSWTQRLIELDGRGGLNSVEVAQLGRGVARQMKLPANKRYLAGLRAFLGFEDNGAGARLEKWCRGGGALWWVFDNDADEIRTDTHITGIDMTAMFKHEACPAVGVYLLHRIEQLMDGRRLAAFFDECRFYLLNSGFASMVEDFALTMRKKESLIVLACQEPGHILGSDVGKSLVSQCATKILFPQKTADYEDYVDGLHCTEAEFKAISVDMHIQRHGARSFLLKRDTGSVILQFDLTDMPDEIAVLSGRETLVRELDLIRAEVGDDPEDMLPEYRRRWRGAVAKDRREKQKEPVE